jgi:hypothetical protein
MKKSMRGVTLYKFRRGIEEWWANQAVAKLMERQQRDSYFAPLLTIFHGEGAPTVIGHVQLVGMHLATDTAGPQIPDAAAELALYLVGHVHDLETAEHRKMLDGEYSIKPEVLFEEFEFLSFVARPVVR